MRNFQKKSKLSQILQTKTSLVILGIIIIVFAFSMIGFFEKMEETLKNKKNVEDKIANLEKSKYKLQSDIEKLKTEKGVEENIREKFGLAKEGENMIMIVDEKNNEEEKNSNDSGFFSFFKNLFR